MAPRCVRELRVALDPVLYARQHLDRANRRRPQQGRKDRCGGGASQPNIRTPRRTRIALKPSLHVIFFPSA
jgi:hypothetical protein